MENNIITWTSELVKRSLQIKEVIILNEFTSKAVELRYFKIDIDSGRLTFNTPYRYFHKFMQETTMNSMEDNCMKNAQYDVHVLFLTGDKKGTIIFQKPFLIACNNYGIKEGHQILLQATTKELNITKGWIYARNNKKCPIQQSCTNTIRKL